MPATNAERVRAYRARQKAAGLEDTSQRRKAEHRRTSRKRVASRRPPRPFVGCDGEGAGQDESGRQNYVLFRMGDRELWAKGRRLHTVELLDFICDHPAEAILVGFAFGYDTTMILRDVPPKQQIRLFEPRDPLKPGAKYVWYRDWNIEYLPKNYLRVCRVQIQHYINEDGDPAERRKIIKGSTRTIYETFGFFQKSFVKAVDDFGVAHPDEMKRLIESKAQRGDDEWTIGKKERDYCALECQLLADLMEKLRDYCEQADIRPNAWSGAGKLAKALHKKHGTLTAKEVAELVPAEVHDFANMAYYGGRFEITRTGLIEQTVYEYDIRSAYPAAMRKLPCLRHGTWKRATAAEIRRHKGLYVGAVAFDRPRQGDGIGQLGGLPIRTREGYLNWPLQGGGVYWSPEIESAERLGVKIRHKGGWTFHAGCDCKPFDWVEELFEYRRSIGSKGPGYPIKLGINSLYGLLAQRKGNGAYTNMIWAGLITAITRGMLNDGIAQAEGSIVMLATDALYSLRPLALDIGERLGQWEAEELEGLFIVQPGLYWCPAKRKRKSRGLSGKFFETEGMTEGFENAWREFRRRDIAGDLSDADFRWPSVSVPVPGFVGLRLALARGRPETAGRWVADKREISFDYTNKRWKRAWSGNHVSTGIKPGCGGQTGLSLPHRDFLSSGGAEVWEGARLMLDEQPEYVDLGIPFKD